MAPQTSYSIYVRFRGRRLALMRHIRSLETARSQLRTFRAERFHDADQVFLVNDATKQIVDERGWEDAGGPRVDQPISVDIRLPTDGTRTERTQDAGNNEADRSLRGAQAPALLAATEAHASPLAATADHLARAEGEARHASPERRWSGVENLEPPRVRLRRAITAAQVARTRHDAALEAMTRLQPGGRMDEMTRMRLNDSARTVSDRSALIIERLEQLLKRLEGAR